MKIEVLRLGHRPSRDKRITTHVCLTARALGASRVRIAEEDEAIRATVDDVGKRFGGQFSIETGTGWKTPIRDWIKAGGQVVHLTMYGEKLVDATPKILQQQQDILVVVGAEKVPSELYDLADYNVAVGNQPHSEVAALAILLDRIGNGQWQDANFAGGEMEVIPSARGKTVVTSEDASATS